MGKKPNILIANKDPKYSDIYEKKLQIEGFEVIMAQPVALDVKVKILRHYPEIVVLEYVMHDANAIDIIRFCKENLTELPDFIVLGDEDENTARAFLLEHGAGNYIKRPFSMNRLCNTAVTVAENKKLKVGFYSETEMKTRIEKLIHLIFKEFKMPLHRNGSSYLAACIYNCATNPELLIGVTKILYPVISKQYNSQSAAVESCMRKSIDCLWKNGDREVLKKYFCDPKTNELRKKKPSSLEFISTVVNIISLTISMEAEILQHDETIYD